MHQNNVVIADNLQHARAVIKWMKLDDSLWHPNIYGGNLDEYYDRIIMARPLAGVTKEYLFWIVTMLTSRVSDLGDITPLHWSYRELEQEPQSSIGWISPQG